MPRNEDCALGAAQCSEVFQGSATPAASKIGALGFTSWDWGFVGILIGLTVLAQAGTGCETRSCFYFVEE